jgi:MFS family permease
MPFTLTRAKALAKWRPAALDVLRLRDYRYFWLSNATADLNYSLRITATSWLVLQLTSSPLWVGLVGGVSGIPAIVLALVGGAVSDRADRRTILLVTRFILNSVAFLTAYLVASGLIEAWHLIPLSLVSGAAFAFAAPSWRVMIVDLVGKERVFTANSLASLAGNAGEIAGPALAGYLIAASGVGPVFYLVAGLQFLGLALLFRMRARSQTAVRSNKSILSDIMAGLDYLRRTPPIPSILVLTLTIIVAMAIIPMMPIYARDVLDAGAGGFGILGAAMGAGFLTGSLITSISGGFRRKGLALIISGAIWDLPMAGFAFSKIFPLSVALVFVMGIGGVIWVNLVVTLLQTLSSEEMRGRVMSLYVIAFQASPLGIMLAGALAEAVSIQFPLLLGAIISTPLGIIVYSLSPKLRQV